MLRSQSKVENACLLHHCRYGAVDVSLIVLNEDGDDVEINKHLLGVLSGSSLVAHLSLLVRISWFLVNSPGGSTPLCSKNLHASVP